MSGTVFKAMCTQPIEQPASTSVLLNYRRSSAGPLFLEGGSKQAEAR